jgi:hypothetical protein
MKELSLLQPCDLRYPYALPVAKRAAGALTMPATISPRSSIASSVAKIGMPRTKF